jgi:hypothetical protein
LHHATEQRCYDFSLATITIDEPLLRELEEIAQSRQNSVEALVRAAVAAKIASHQPQPLPMSLGMIDSGNPGAAHLAGEMPYPPQSWI